MTSGYGSSLPHLRRPEDLEEPGLRAEPALRVSTASVVVADYARLQSEFPQLRDPVLLADEPNLAPEQRRAAVQSRIDAWLIREAALISACQAAQDRVNTPIETVGEPLDAYRPPRYGRSFVAWVRGAGGALDLQREGLLDLKGTGVAPAVEPTRVGQSDGLFMLEKALADLCIQNVLDAIFAHAGVAFYTVPTYAVLDLGFDILLEMGQRVPAGLQVRKGHRRPLGGAELPKRGSAEQHVKFEIEMLLRHYGVTSSNSATTLSVVDHEGRLCAVYAGKPVDLYSQRDLEPLVRVVEETGARRFDCINIQTTREFSTSPSSAHLVDFGHYRVHDHFDHPVVSLVSDRVLRWGGFLAPDHPYFIHPNPAFALPMEGWGASVPPDDFARARGFPPGHPRPKTMLLAYEWVNGLRSGVLSRDDVQAQMEAHVATATCRFAALSE